MEKKLIASGQTNMEKVWNWNMDNNCAKSCANLLVAHMHIINAVTLIVFLILCYFVTLIINFVQYKNFTITTESLLFASIIIYASWNIFFGFPTKKLEENINEVSLSYTSCAMSQFISIIAAALILFLNHAY